MGEAIARPVEKPVRDHVRFIGWLQMAQSAAFAINAVLFLTGLFPVERRYTIRGWMMLLAMPGTYSTLSLASFAVGWGLLHRRRWARFAAIPGACLLLAGGIAYGYAAATGLGVYAFWVLLSNERTKTLRGEG